MISEGLVTTYNEDRSVNVSPMGPEVDRPLSRFVLKPFRTSRTYQNLKRTGGAVFHVVDDVELLARCAVGDPDPLPGFLSRTDLPAPVLQDACRWYALEVVIMDDAAERTRIECRLTQQGKLRDFWGFNRAKHAVLEAAILATRIQFLSPQLIGNEFQRLREVVDKTAGSQELRAMQFLEEYVHSRLEAESCDHPF